MRNQQYERVPVFTNLFKISRVCSLSRKLCTIATLRGVYPVHGLFVPWTVRTVDCSYLLGLFVPWTIRTVPGLFVPWTVRTVDCSYSPGLFVPWTVRTVPGRCVPC